LEFSKAPLGALPPWQLPEKMAHAPFTQFTAARGLSPWLRRMKWWTEIFGETSPDQLFFWSLGESQISSYLALPVTAPEANLERLYAKIQPYFGTNGFLNGRPELATNHQALAVFNPLGLKPVAAHVKQGDKDFLLAALWPANASTNTIPARLQTTLKDPQLVYHDVEFTPESVQHWNMIFQVYQIVKGHPVNAPRALAHDWMWNNYPELGDSVTVIRQASPNRLVFERTSSLGLTGSELVLATRWLDGPIKGLRSGRIPLPVMPK
jgi:hypothetical protein